MFRRFGKRKGFSLIELLIVIAIIGIIATIAIPILLSARENAIREKARNSLRAVVSAEFGYYAQLGSYGSLPQLIAGGYIGNNIASPGQGIVITVTATATDFDAEANAAFLNTLPDVFTADETGQINAN